MTRLTRSVSCIVSIARPLPSASRVFSTTQGAALIVQTLLVYAPLRVFPYVSLELRMSRGSESRVDVPLPALTPTVILASGVSSPACAGRLPTDRTSPSTKPTAVRMDNLRVVVKARSPDGPSRLIRQVGDRCPAIGRLHVCNQTTPNIAIGRGLTLDQTVPVLPFYRRFADRRLAEALEDSPAVLIHGPRQRGKTTLAQVVCAPRQLPWRGPGAPWTSSPESNGAEYPYHSFDDDVVRGGAEADPMGFVASLPERVVRDEVQ